MKSAYLITAGLITKVKNRIKKDALRAVWCIWKYNNSVAAKVAKYSLIGALIIILLLTITAVF